MWQEATGRPISVAFFMHDKRYLSDDLTIRQALTDPSSVSLELRAFTKSKFRVQLHGLESTSTLFEVAANLSPAAVRRDIARAVGIYTDDYRLTYDGDELDLELPFNEQGLQEGAQLMVDLQVILKILFEENNETKTNTLECFSSDSVGDLRQRLNLDDDIALVSTSPYRRVLEDSLHVCHIVEETAELETCIHLSVEQRVMLTFEPITLEHLRQKLPVALSSTPFDIYDLVREHFQLVTEFRLAVAGEKLDNSKSLFNQLTDIDNVIQIDIKRPFIISDMWKGLLDEESFEEVLLYSSENSYALYLRDEINGQRLFYDDINLTILGSVVDIFGGVSGKEKPFVLVDRDVQRNFPTLSFDGIVRRLGWAQDMLIDIVTTSGSLPPKEIMRNGYLLPSKSNLNNLHLTEDTLMITDPEKIFTSSNKKLCMYRFAHGATYGDVRERMQQLKGCLDIGLKTYDWNVPNEAKDRKLDRELLFLTNESRFQTRLTVTVKGQWYGCWFTPQQVSFTDVMIKVGKQAEVMPRLLFSKKLYCCGCKRELSMEEEPHQAIPAACCSVKSLRLTDRRVKDVGIQTAGTRRRDVETYTFSPEARDSCVGTDSAHGRAVVRATPYLKSAATAHPSPSSSLRVGVLSPEGEEEKRTVTVEGDNCGALLASAQRQLASVSLGDSPVIYSESVIYDRNGEERRALRCFDEKTGGFHFIDLEDGGLAEQSSWLRFSHRFLRLSSPLPSSSYLLPYVVIRTEVEFLSATPKNQLQATPARALKDPSFVVLMHGVRSGMQYFWQRPGSRNYVSVESDRVFSLNDIPEGPKRFVFALLRDKDLVPRAKVPEGKGLFVFRRTNLQPRVEAGCVRCAASPLPTDMDVWDIPSKPDAFLRHFVAAARK